jgi:hypothetical protein
MAHLWTEIYTFREAMSNTAFRTSFQIENNISYPDGFFLITHHMMSIMRSLKNFGGTTKRIAP